VSVLTAAEAPSHPATPTWRSWQLAALTCASAYSTAIGWQAQLVSYPLYRAVPTDAFTAYHAEYNDAIPLVVIGPGFVTFLASIAFWWTNPGWVSRRTAGVVSASGAVALLATVLWAIPRHDDLDRDGKVASTIDSLLQANQLRTAALTVGAVALGWCVALRLARG
jgi:hypothetical protein